MRTRRVLELPPPAFTGEAGQEMRRLPLPGLPPLRSCPLLARVWRGGAAMPLRPASEYRNHGPRARLLARALDIAASPIFGPPGPDERRSPGPPGNAAPEGAGRRRPGASPAPSRILLIRPDHAGDLLMATPAIRALRRALPEATLDLLRLSVGRARRPGQPGHRSRPDDRGDLVRAGAQGRARPLAPARQPLRRAPGALRCGGGPARGLPLDPDRARERRPAAAPASAASAWRRS